MVQLPAENQIPLVVDLDGTLIKTDVMWESLAQRLRINPLALFVILLWWTRGRAFLKHRLARTVHLNPATLPVTEPFLAWLREQKASGRKIILATASDFQMAKPIADYFGIFDEVMASDGRANLRSENKLRALVAKFGEKGFDYAGNSSADLAVWRGARKAIVVNASLAIQKKAAEIADVAASFCETDSGAETLGNFLNELFLRSGYLIAAASGLLLAAAFPKVEFAGAAWIAPGLLAFAAQNKKGGDAIRVGVVAGLAFWLASLYWLLEIPYRWHGIPLGPAAGWLALCAVLSLFSGAWAWLVAIPEPRNAGYWAGRFLWAFSGAAGWVALEMIRARLFGGFPWNFLGASQIKMVPLIQIASVTGVYGVSFLAVWMSLSFYSAVRMIFAMPQSRFAWQPEIFPPLLAVAIIFAWGEFRVSAPAPTTVTLRVAAVQPSIPQTLIWDENANAQRFQQLIRLSETALTNGVDLLLWPESAVPEFDTATYAAITNLASQHHVWLIFNADDVIPKASAPDQFDAYNAAFLFGPDGQPRVNEIYHKQKLVMFGEYIPLARWLPFIKWFTPIPDSYLFGKSAMQFDLEDLGVTCSPLICYEDMFPQMGRAAAATGADFLVNLTNDGWFGDSAEQWQHENGAIFRTVENGIPLVRCCNNGITCWIDACGRQRDIFRDDNGSVYGEGTMLLDLPLQKPQPTFYTRHGDLFGWSCAGIALVAGLRKARKR